MTPWNRRLGQRAALDDRKAVYLQDHLNRGKMGTKRAFLREIDFVCC
jgi:hypothetical protein